MKAKLHPSQAIIENPLFNIGKQYQKPKSAKDLIIIKISRDIFMPLNMDWHSRLPDCKNCFEGFFFGAKFDGKYYAVAWWSKPVARQFNNLGYVELRRLAIHEDAPKFTATRMLSKMIKIIRKKYPEINKCISYQDTEVHTGTIYKAGNWKLANIGQKVKKGWESRDSNRQNQSTAPKIRWEFNL